MMKHLTQAFDFDIHIRMEDDKCSPSGVKVQVTEVQEGVIYDSGGIRVTAFEVDHRPVSPAFGYRIDYAGRSVVLSGDTRFSMNLTQFADRVDGDCTYRRWDGLYHEVHNEPERQEVLEVMVGWLQAHTQP